MTPYEIAQQQFMSGTYHKQVITGEIIRQDADYYYTRDSKYSKKWYRLPNQRDLVDSM